MLFTKNPLAKLDVDPIDPSTGEGVAEARLGRIAPGRRADVEGDVEGSR
jgi:hypothetical protein